ncbi:MAG: MFS transporter [Candidatus Binataceae bacterium]
MRALGVVSLFNDIAGHMIQPLMPGFIAKVGGGPQVLGIIEGVADSAASLLQIPSGYLADRMRRLKRLTFVGYVTASALRPLLALATSSWEILLLRVGDRAGKGIRGAPRDTLLAETTAQEQLGRAYGFHRAMDYAGAIIGPAIAYGLLATGFTTREVFAVTAVPGAVTLCVLGFGVDEVGARAVVAAEKIRIGLPHSPLYRRAMIAIFVFTLGASSDTFLLWRAREVGVSLEYAPILWMLLALVKSATSTWGGALSDARGRRKLILAGWSVYAAVYLGFGFATEQWQIWALFAAYGTFFGLTESAETALVVDLVDERWRGRALGAYHAVVGAASLPASLIFGVVYQHEGARVAFAMAAGIALVAALILPKRPRTEYA